MGREDRWIIVCSTMNARGTAKIAKDYFLFLQGLGFKVEIVSPRLSVSRLYGLVWELAAIYMKRVDKQSNLVLVNGRVSPLLNKRSCNMLLVTLDMMNYGWSAFISSETSWREKINIVVNTLFVPGSQGKAKWRSVISRKTQLDLVELDATRDLRLKKASIIYPCGSFASTSESDWEERAIDRGGLLETEKDVTKALWITGETKNKGFINGTKTLSGLDKLGTRMDVEILGIRSNRLRVDHQELMDGAIGIRSVFRTRLSEHDLIELYTRSNIALCLSEEEGFGLPFMDAILFGLPVIARRIDTYNEICALVSAEGINVPPVLWIQDKSMGARDGTGADRASRYQEFLLQARDFIRIQAGHVKRDVREERKRNYRDSANVLIKRSCRDLERLIATED